MTANKGEDRVDIMAENGRLETATESCADVMTIGDLLIGQNTQELWEVRLEAGKRARKDLKKLNTRLSGLLFLRDTLSEYLYVLKDEVERRARRYPKNHKKVKQAEDWVKAEKVRLQANPQYVAVRHDIRECRARIDRAHREIDAMPIER